MAAKYERCTVDAICHVMKEWMERKHGSLMFRLVQVMTSNDYFGQYLHRVARRELTTVCHGCSAAEETTFYTLREWDTWRAQRRILIAVVGEDLALPKLVEVMLGNERAWDAMAYFCEDVISQKEAAERVCEEDALSDPLRLRRASRRRRRYNHLLNLS